VPIEYTLQDIARRIHGEAIGDKNKSIRGVESFETAVADQITFAGGKKYLKRINDTQAGAISSPKGSKFPGKNLIRVSNPPLAFAKVGRIISSRQSCRRQALTPGRHRQRRPHR
jgi:UDP-3-O-[3-hydroxymyristoyl] glucosamine N-acyltransferase